MLLTHKLRLAISYYSYVETGALMAGFFTLGYIIDPHDPALIYSGLAYITFVMSIITLFHGISNGLFAVFGLAAVMKFFYPVFPTEAFLNEVVFVLVFGEFHYYWNRKIIQNKTKNSYLGTKLDELSNAFYMLKISHDQLEKNYVFKPMSLRNSIRLIKEAYVDKKDYFKNFLLILQKSFNVTKAELYAVEKERLYSVYDQERLNEIKISDPMIETALLKKRPIYVSSKEVKNNSRYLAVIPAVSQDKVKGLLLIEKMPFLSFNKDVLISISILVTYFLEELGKWDIIRQAGQKNTLVNDEFYFELMRLNKIYTEYDVNSALLILKTKDRLFAHMLLEKTQENLRSLDMVSAHASDGYEVLGILFPFADQASAQGFLDRLFLRLKLELDDEKIEYTFFDISQLEIVKEYAGINHVNV
jgi:hypothetical protein